MNIQKLRLIGIVFLLIVIASMWLFFLRSVPTQHTTGIVVSKTFKPAGVSYSYPYGANRGFKTPTSIPTAPGYSYRIETPGIGEVGYFANEIEAKSLDVNQKVSIKYEERGIPMIWKKIMVLEITPVVQ